MKDRRYKVSGYYLPGAKVAFVPIRGGLWIRTHPCVLFVKCPWCKAKAGDACEGSIEAHASRKKLFNARTKNKLPGKTIISEAQVR